MNRQHIVRVREVLFLYKGATMAESVPRYVFARGERSVFVEIYFPRKAAYQGAIFDALREGYDIRAVREYLSKNTLRILQELRAYPHLFDPYRYRKGKVERQGDEVDQARERIRMYRSPFQGWSLYQVDGVFVNKEGLAYEEATQVARIIFRQESGFRKVAEEAGCEDVLRAIRFWIIDGPAGFTETEPWGPQEQACFLARLEPVSDTKRAFVERFFAPIAREAVKWIDNCALFVFGYLVRKFSEKVLAEHLTEEEVWVTSFFNLTVNVVKRTE